MQVKKSKLWKITRGGFITVTTLAFMLALT